MKPAGDVCEAHLKREQHDYTCLECGFSYDDMLFLACERCPACDEPFTFAMYARNREVQDAANQVIKDHKKTLEKLARECNRCLSETKTLPCSVCGGRTFSYTFSYSEVIDKSKLLEELDKLVRYTDGHDLRWEGWNEALREVRRIVEGIK